MNESVEPKERLEVAAILGPAAASKAGWMQRRESKWAAAIMAVLLLMSAAWWFTGRTPNVRYVMEPATRDNLTVIVTATGSVQPTNKVDVSSELSGTVRKVLVDYNSPVTAGQTLAELDTDKLQATVRSSRAKLAAARAKVVEAEATVVEKERDLARKRSLSKTQVVSTQDLDQSQAAYDRAVAAVASARADVDVAEANLQLDETNLAKARIFSPINGVVLTRNVDPGQTVASSLQAPVLFTIAEDLRQMELQVDVDEADVGQVKAAQTAMFSVDAFPDRHFPATIRDIRYASETVQGVVTYKAILDIDNSELLLRPGMTATAEVTVTRIQDALLIPNAALRYTPTATDAATTPSFVDRLLPRPRFRKASQPDDAGRNRTVWVLSDGAPMAVKVEVGSSDGRKTQILSGGLEAGQMLIVSETTGKR